MHDKENTDFSKIYSENPGKPYAHIERVIDYFRPHAHIFETKNKQIFNYVDDNENRILILLEGSICLYRKHDNMILNSESAPFIFGMSQQFTSPEYLFLKTQEPCVVGTLPLNTAHRLIKDNNLWESLARLLIYTVSRVHDHCAKISQFSAYEIIRYQLIELMNETPEIRNSITAANYIISRTFLSRSGTMRILSELKAGNYITVEKGMLKAVNHLPQKY
ncbi:putative DNA-binding transcriptional regulator [Buttiauxella agrestis]|uniref:Putative DNA-binding transcriptional regulator n=1 Tax=Buttiauxella agrestis TaxID=82977 RepID=A0A381C9Q5_9ENTR|nr:winged helix-turn-helix transcriptional regulator [Buttiauxella agrestis]SUW63733.1 putative DNA-binding transcriptional regulator [Buttiauxella agrestis]